MKRGGNLKRKTHIPARRLIDRIKSRGRVTHERMAPKKTKPNAAQQRYWDSLPKRCEGCGIEGYVSPHHILETVPDQERHRDHMLVVMLCPGCHNLGDVSVHLLGSEALFFAATGRDLVAIAVANRNAWRANNG